MSELQRIENFVIFKTATAKVNVAVYFKDNTLWLTQKLIGQLFDKGRSTITEHLKHLFSDGELEEDLVCRDFRHTAEDGKNYTTKYYNFANNIKALRREKEAIELFDEHVLSFNGRDGMPFQLVKPALHLTNPCYVRVHSVSEVPTLPSISSSSMKSKKGK